jgi:probable LLM family oxidoreductase
MEFGLYTFGDLVANPATGAPVSASQRLEEIIAAAKLADDAGLDVFGVGEHHRLDFAISAPAVLMAAIAKATHRIRLTSAVTVLSAADPVRVFEDIATVDLISKGRAELIVGRGAFPEPFPLFGVDVRDYDELFSEKFDLLERLGCSERVSWSGLRRSALNDVAIAPRPLQPRVPTWIAVGGTPESAVRAGTLGAPMALAVLGGPIAHIKALVDLYRQAGRRAGRPASALKLAISSHLHVAVDPKEARDSFFPHYAAYWAEASPRGSQPAMTRSQFERSVDPSTALLVGSVDEVVDKILLEHRLTGNDRLLAQIDIGGLPFRSVARVIELLGTEVAPRVRKALALTGSPRAKAVPLTQGTETQL